MTPDAKGSTVAPSKDSSVTTGTGSATPAGPATARAPVPTSVTPSRIWKRMTREQREQAALAFWRDEQATDDQVQAALLIAQQKKFRPKTIIALDEGRKARHLASLLSVPDTVAARALIAYHLAEQRPMMVAFLDALGMAHENGLIEQDGVTPPPDKLAPAAAAIAERFPAADVSLYLNTLACQDPDTWGGLRDLPQLQ